MPSTVSRHLPEYLSVQERYAIYRPVAEVTFAIGSEMVANIVRFCVDAGITNLLLDVIGLTGFPPPTLAERYYAIEQLATIAEGKVRIAEVDREEQLDPSETNVIIASNRGLQFNVFTDETEAIEWLLR